MRIEQMELFEEEKQKARLSLFAREQIAETQRLVYDLVKKKTAWINEEES